MAEQPDEQPDDERRGFPPRWAAYAMVAALLLLLYYFFVTLVGPQQQYSPIAYSQFKMLLKQGAVTEVTLSGHVVQGTLAKERSLGPKGEKGKHFQTRVPEFGDNTLMAELEQGGVELRVAQPPQANVFSGILYALLPWLLIFGVMFWIMRRAARNITGPSDQIKGLLQSPAREIKEGEVPKVTFDNVAGQENAKREVSELVDYLKNPDKYLEMGAELPRGVLLMGAPGTGKTLLARALAGEAGVPFYSISGSEFIEVFVGVGAGRVRRLFGEAKKHSPSIIFIDELDSIGRTRGTGLGGGHDEREQTLNQILSEMDGFSGHEAVLVLAATNRPDVLDPALLRPGRFDRHVPLDLPDREDRLAILKVHTPKMPLAEDVDLGQIATATTGFSGADLKNLVNEAAILAAREGRKQVTMHDFDEVRDKVTIGTERSLSIQPEERHRLAVHESGHTLAAYHLAHADKLYKVSIVPRGSSLGATQQLPEHERYTLSEDYLRDRLAVTLAGRAAERVVLDSVSSGADSDIREATRLARSMAARWGMSEAIGPVDLRESEDQPFLGREIAQPRRHSEHSAEVVDEAVRQLLVQAEERALQLIRKHRPELDKLVAALEEHETLYREQIEACLGSREAAKGQGKAAAAEAAKKSTSDKAQPIK